MTRPFLILPLAFLVVFLGVSCCCWLKVDFFAPALQMVVAHETKEPGCCPEALPQGKGSPEKCYCRWQINSILTKKLTAMLVQVFKRPIIIANRNVKPAGFKAIPADFPPCFYANSGPPLFIKYEVYRL